MNMKYVDFKWEMGDLTLYPVDFVNRQLHALVLGNGRGRQRAGERRKPTDLDRLRENAASHCRQAGEHDKSIYKFCQTKFHDVSKMCFELSLVRGYLLAFSRIINYQSYR